LTDEVARNLGKDDLSPLGIRRFIGSWQRERLVVSIELIGEATPGW
jgi:hypothetical protein